jgi:uncharacterized protein YciI
MSNDSRKTVADLLAPMLKKTLFVAINHVAAPASAIEPFVAEHLAYMNALEAEGHLWASGPFIEEGVLVGDGLTILSTSTIEQARQAWKKSPSSSGGCAPSYSGNGSCARAGSISRCTRRSPAIRFDASSSPDIKLMIILRSAPRRLQPVVSQNRFYEIDLEGLSY